MDVLWALAGVVALVVVPLSLMVLIGWLSGRYEKSELRARRLDHWDRKH